MIREKATLQELSDRLQVPTAVDADGAAYAHNEEPSLGTIRWVPGPSGAIFLNTIFEIDYTGDWRDSLHFPQHQYVKGELVWVWHDVYTFARVRKVDYIEDEKIYTLDPGQLDAWWPNHRPYDESLLGVPIAEWPEE